MSTKLCLLIFNLLLLQTTASLACSSDCSTFSKSTNSKTLNSVNCSTSDGICTTSQSNKSISLPYYRCFWNINDEGDVTTNFTFGPPRDSSLSDILGFKLIVNHLNYQNISKRNFTKYFCLNGFTLDFVKHSNSKFAYSCLRDLEPGDYLWFVVVTVPSNDYGQWLVDGHGWSNKFDRLTDRRPKVLRIPFCGEDQKLNSSKFCQLQNKISISTSSVSCLKSSISVFVHIPSGLGRKYLLRIYFNENKDIVFYQTYLNISQDFLQTNLHIPISNLTFRDDYVIEVMNDRLNHVSRSVQLNLKTCQSSRLMLIGFTIFLVPTFIFFTSLILYYIKTKKIKSFCSKQSTSLMIKGNLKEEPISEPSVKQTKVYLGFYDTNPQIINLMIEFAKYLQTSIGLDVIFELWSEEEIQKGLSVWIEKALSSCDKFILAWSPSSIQLLNNLDSLESVESTSFIPIALQIKSELLKCTVKKQKFLSVYFDEKLARDIPCWFCKLIDRHFLLMEQFNELYFTLVDKEPFVPGKKLVLKFQKLQTNFQKAITDYRSSKDDDDVIIDDTNHLLVKPPNLHDEIELSLPVIPPNHDSVDEIKLLIVNLPDF